MKLFIKKYIKIVFILVLFLVLILEYTILYFYNNKKIIKIIINPSLLMGLYYYELIDDGTMYISYAIPDSVDANISSTEFNLDFLNKEKITIDKNKCSYIFGLAEKAVEYGNIEESTVLDGVYCEFYYKGVTQKIYRANDDYDELYKLFIEVTNFKPRSFDMTIDINSQIPYIYNYQYK